MIRWITDQLGTASYYDYERLDSIADVQLVDVRELTDSEGNDPGQLLMFIDGAANQLRRGKRLVVCCDKGISRSNAIALGTLLATGMGYEQALRRLVEELGSTDIDLGLLKDICKLYGFTQQQKPDRPTRILITGATGYIGRAVLDTLGSDYEFVTLDRSRYDLCRDLLLLDAFVNDYQIDSILHLAHPRLRNNISAMGDALMMMKTILELCRLNGLCLVYLSSLIIFSGYTGADTDTIQAGPSLPPRPKGLYAETKYFCDQLVRLYQESSSVPAVVIRPAAVHGPHMDRSTLVSKFFEWAAQNKIIRTHRYRNGLPAFDFLYIDDLVEAIRLALDVRPTIPVHVGTGVATTTYDLARKIVQITDSASQVETVDIHDETSRIIGNPAEAMRQLRWESKVDLEAGLRLVWERNRHDYD